MDDIILTPSSSDENSLDKICNLQILSSGTGAQNKLCLTVDLKGLAGECLELRKNAFIPRYRYFRFGLQLIVNR